MLTKITNYLPKFES